MPQQAAPIDLSLVTARVRSIAAGHLAGTSVTIHAIMQLRISSQSEAYVVYYLGRGRHLTVWFNGTAQGAYGPSAYLGAIDAFCEAAHMPPLDSRQSVTWAIAGPLPTEPARTPCHVCQKIGSPAVSVRYQGQRPMHFCDDHAVQVGHFAPEEYAVSVRRTLPDAAPAV